MTDSIEKGLRAWAADPILSVIAKANILGAADRITELEAEVEQWKEANRRNRELVDQFKGPAASTAYWITKARTAEAREQALRVAAQAVHDWYSRDGSVGAAAEPMDKLSVALATTEEPDA